MTTKLCLSLNIDADRLMTQYLAHPSIFRTAPTLFTTAELSVPSPVSQSRQIILPSRDVTFSISVTHSPVSRWVSRDIRDTMVMHCDVKMVSLKRVTVMKFLFKLRGEKQGIMD